MISVDIKLALIAIQRGQWHNGVLGELCLSGNHTVTKYEMSGEPYSQKSRWIKHSNERIFQVMTFK